MPIAAYCRGHGCACHSGRSHRYGGRRCSMSKQFTLEDDFASILKGEADLPNDEPIDAMFFLSNLASGGHSMTAKWGWAKVNGKKDWAYFFLTPAGMGGRLDGGGYAIVW